MQAADMSTLPEKAVGQAAKLPDNSKPRQHGFTLVEMIVVIVIIGILAGIAAVFLVHPIQGYMDLSRRAALVEAAESALRRMARDIRIALPNSVRVTNIGGVGDGFALELIPTIDGGRYCDTSDATPGPGRCTNALDFSTANSQFDLLGCFRDSGTPTAPGRRLVINNLGIPGNDVYDGVTVITPAATTVTIAPIAPNTCPTGGNHQVTLSPSHQFRGGSSGRRVFVVQKPVTYLCTPNLANPATGTLVRYADYAIQASQPTTAATLNGLSGVVADRMSACSVTTSTTQVQERGLVTLDISIATEGETIRLIHQVALDNSR